MDGKESSLQQHLQRHLQHHATFLGQAWASYCVHELERQEALQRPCAASTKLFLRDCDLDPSAPIAQWSRRLARKLHTLPKEANDKARSILRELSEYRDVCIAGNKPLLQQFSLIHPHEFAKQYDALTMDALPSWYLIVHACPRVIQERNFSLRHFAVAIVPEKKGVSKRSAAMMDADSHVGDDAYASAWLDHHRRIGERAHTYIHLCALWKVAHEWQRLNADAPDLRALPVDYDNDGDDERDVDDIKGVEWSYLGRLMPAFAKHQTMLRLRHLKVAHHRWMTVAQPWLRSGAPAVSDAKQRQLLDEHANQHERMSTKLAALVIEDGKADMEVALAERTRIWKDWLQAMPAASEDDIAVVERRWKLLRRTERDKMIAYLEGADGDGLRHIQAGYAKQRAMEQEFVVAFQPPQQEPTVTVPTLSIDLIPGRTLTKLTRDIVAYQREHLSFVELFEKSWCPVAEAVEQQLRQMKWQLPATLRAAATTVSHVPLSDAPPTWQEWMTWVEHVSFTLACYVALQAVVAAPATAAVASAAPL